MTELYIMKNYFNPLYDFLISHYIREYDMEKSNISILYEQGIIQFPKYCELYNADRQYRQEYVGKLILKKPEIQKILEIGVIDAKEKLFKANNISNNNVLTIKNDAVFIIDQRLSILEFQNPIRFIEKNTYTSFYKLGDKNAKELYYYYDAISGNEKLDVKGINDKLLYLHEPYFIEFLKQLFCSAQVESIEDCLEILNVYYNQYVDKKLEIGHYRRFSADCMYDLKKMSYNNSFQLQDVGQENISNINIAYNLKLIKELNKLFSSIYMSTKRM